ncbi:PucR family transcriptional regulator ligand-binding domain-containing protein [Brevibacillus ruminantium]|uniref:PucR family transcriptional regulator ligand-binding domain-containing protein n=1 Tax=Brevibacillus ruminantium TaxID=2950604 RepID=A0ABY4WEB8_9BACL|nr:PucR family transcriptional regulator [Brevibacillus ruminantium]USG65533.1 PucR family transcriptional regulator ligand-binding domain-containing protein [Brevibacillus ruminantium]
MANDPLTVEQLMHLPAFQGAKIMAGIEGMKNEIYYVDSMEIPDLTGWLRPHELIITTGYALRDEPFLLSRLLEEMHRVGGSAIAIKTKRFLQEIPEEALRKSDLYRIPLIDIPAEIPYIDLTHSVMENILNRQLAVMRGVHEINQQFTHMVLNRRTPELVVLLGKLLHGEVAVLNTEGEVVNSTAHFTAERIADKRPIQVNNRAVGYVALTRIVDQQDRFGQMCLDQAVTVLAIEFTIRQSLQLQREREQESFLVELLSGTAGQEELLRYRAKQVGIPHVGQQYVMMIALSDPNLDQQKKEELLLTLLNKINQGEKPYRKGVLINDQLAVICATTQTDVAGQREEAKHYLENWIGGTMEQDVYKEWRCGLGCIHEKLEDLRLSYREAKRALQIGSLIHPAQSVVHFEDILVEDLLEQTRDHPSLVSLSRRFIVPLVAYDQEFGTELLATLESFLRTGGQTKKVGEELFIHRNSVLYRLERITEILGVNLHDAETRFRLDLVMRAWKLRGLASDAEGL